MKKVILAVDGTNFSTGAFEFIRRLNELQPLMVTGVFVPQLDYANLWSYAPTGMNAPVFIPLIEEEENVYVLKNIARFEKLCQANGIAYRVHKDFSDFALPELKEESRFADVMILSGELFYKHIIGANQYDYIRNVLHNSECPVLVVPEKFTFPQNNILAYNGSEESVYAMKQFAYVFPELAANKTLLVYADENVEKEFPSKHQVIELASQHFKNLTLYKADINPKKYFREWIGEQEASILVSGSYHRSIISETFKKSFVADLIQDHQLPVFVAHK